MLGETPMLCPLDEVLKTETLKRRINRAPNLTAQNETFHRLSQQLLRPPMGQLQALLDSALTLCSAGSAGISLLEPAADEPVFRWVALAGRYASFVGGTTPRYASPCGVTRDRGTPQLFFEPGRHFECFANAEPPIIEGLVLPIKGFGADPGTIWIVSHTRKIEFDMEDVRVMESLAGFAAFACSQLASAVSN